MKIVVACCFAAILAAACAEPDRQEEGTSIVTDARQRVISNVEGNAAAREASRVACVEPSPDVALSVADALSASRGDIAVGTKPQVAGSTSNADVASIAQIGERLMAIQLLRDGTYRACEAYAAGAISGATYTKIVSRHDDLLVTLVLAAAERAPTAPGAADARAIADARDQVTAAARALATASAMPDTDATAQTAREQALANARTKLDEALNALAKLEIQAMSATVSPP